MDIYLEGEPVALLPQRALYWPARKTLIVADLHWGKSETFRHAGIPIPDALLDGDLTRLSNALSETGAQRLLVLGDLIHAIEGLTPELAARIGRWRNLHAITLQVIRGNHDRHLKNIPAEWALELLDDALEEGPFLFAHDPKPVKGRYVLGGHLHPTMRLKGGGDSLRLPCFHLEKKVGTLPAFSHFTGGVPIRRTAGDRAYVIADDRVLEIR